MIVGNIGVIDSDNDNIAIALDWIKKEKWKGLDVGRYEIKGNDVYAMVQSYKSKNYLDGKFESHKDYIDIQMVISGHEFMFASNDNSLLSSSTGYDKDNDIEFFQAEPKTKSKIYMEPGVVCILFPSDFHKPCILREKSENIKKLVIKVHV